MSEIFQLEVAGAQTNIELSGRLQDGSLRSRLRSFEPAVPFEDGFNVEMTIEAGSENPEYLGFVFEGSDRLLFNQPGLKGIIDLVNRQAAIRIAALNPEISIDYFLRVLYAILVFDSGGVLIHAAGMVRGGGGYLFLGPSGTGKTTVSSLSNRAVILNDDLVVLREGSGNWQLWSTPFSGAGQVKPNAGWAPLRRIVRLMQSSSHRLEALAPPLALAELVVCCPVVTVDQLRGKALLERLRRLLGKYGLQTLHFAKDSGFWAILDASAGGGNESSEMAGHNDQDLAKSSGSRERCKRLQLQIKSLHPKNSPKS